MPSTNSAAYWGVFFVLPLLMLSCGYGIKGFLFRRFLKGRLLDYFTRAALAPIAISLAIIWVIGSVTLDNPDRSVGFVFLSFAILFSVIDHMYFTKRSIEEHVFRVRSIVSNIVLSLLLAALCYVPYTVGMTGNCGGL